MIKKHKPRQAIPPADTLNAIITIAVIISLVLIMAWMVI